MPNGAEEKFRWGDRREPPSFLQGKVGYRIAPSSAPVCALGHLPPKGKALSCAAPSRLQNHPLPARPAGGRAVTGVRYRAAGQAEKKREPPQGPPNPSRESRGENLSPLALFPPVSREKRGPPPGRCPTGRCAPRPRKSPAHPQGTQYRPPKKSTCKPLYSIV